jgi:hypothetical protein
MKADQINRRRRADEHYEDIGRSVAALVVDTKIGARRAWAMLGGIDLYRFWMLKHWVDRYKKEQKPVTRRPAQPPHTARTKTNTRSTTRKELLDQLKSGRALDRPV